MNSSKCAFTLSSRKLLGFIIHRMGIDLAQAKGKAIQAILNL